MADSPGPMGGACPVCGRYWNVRGCTPGDCRSTPEPVVETTGGTVEARDRLTSLIVEDRARFRDAIESAKDGG